MVFTFVYCVYLCFGSSLSTVRRRQQKRGNFASMFVVKSRDLLKVVVLQWKILVGARITEERGRRLALFRNGEERGGFEDEDEEEGAQEGWERSANKRKTATDIALEVLADDSPSGIRSPTMSPRRMQANTLNFLNVPREH